MLKTDTSDKEVFYFEVEDDATESEIEQAHIEALWESGILDTWYAEVDGDGD